MAPKAKATATPITTPARTTSTPAMQLDDGVYTKSPGLAGYKPVALDARQRNSWDMTRSALLWNCPAFTHVLYTMMARQDDSLALFTKDIERAATDGSTMMLNPDWFFKLSLPQRVFVCAHEICHAIFDHCGQSYVMKLRGHVLTSSGKKIPYDGRCMNISQDLVINDVLIESKIGEFVKEGCHDTNIAIHSDSAVDVYEKVYKEQKGSGKGGQAPGRGTFDEHMEPGQADGKDPTQTQQSRSSVEWDMAVAAGAAQAKAQGKLPAALERLLGELLDPEVPWQDKIQAFFNRKIGSGSYDWRRPDRRLIVRDIYAPGRSGFGANHVVVAIDTSGSIGDTELARFFAEMRGIMEEVKPKKLTVIWCDAIVQKVDEIEDIADMGGLKPKGGGGTCFKPPFEWVEKNSDGDIDAMVYLTDGYGSFPDHCPKYPVLWGAIVPGVVYPWGEVIDVPIKDKK